MTKKEIYAIVGAVAVVIVLVLAGVLAGKRNAPGGGAAGPKGGAATSTPPKPIGYDSKIPAGATLTPPKNEAPASANPELDTKIRFFNLKASRDGFAPASITVNQGDSLSIDFTAADGDYDLDFPYLGAYFPAMKQGTTRKIPIDTSLTGTFTFQCRDRCPQAGQIKGSLIVLPKK